MQHLSKTMRGLALLATTLLALTACNDDELVPGGENGKYVVRISAGTSDDGTRTSLLPDGQVVWDKGDNFRVVTNGMSVDWNMTLTNGVGESRGEFEGTSNSSAAPEGTAMAVYPYEALQNYQNNDLTITLPKTQKYEENSFDHKANVMMGTLSGSDGNYHVSFKNMMGVLQLKLTGDNITLSKITLTDNDGKNLWGIAAVDYSKYESGIGCNSVTDGGCVLTLDCSGVKLTSEETTFHFVVPTGAFEHGFEATIYDTNNRYQTISTSKANIIELNDIKAMPKLDINNLVKVEEFNIHNDAIKYYLERSGDPRLPEETNIFDAFDYWGNSLIGNPKSNYQSQDRPASYKLWTGNNEVTHLITLIDKTNGKEIYHDRLVTAKEYSLTNFVPEHIYTYIVKDEQGSTQKKGEIKATGQIREVAIEGTWNYRDLGGWKGLNGNKIKYEWIYRGGSLNGVWKFGTEKKNHETETNNPIYYTFPVEGKQQIEDMGIKAELDLRAPKEGGEGWAHTTSLGKENIGFDDPSLWHYMNLSSSNALHNPMSNDTIICDVKWIIEQVISEHRPVAFHCKSGADRTGGVALTLEALLGVNRYDIARDYEITHFSREKEIVEGKKDWRGKLANDRGSEVDKFYRSGFAFNKDIKGDNLQQKAYYYLNRYAKDKGWEYISSIDLDAFIEFMLDMPAGTYQHPSWAVK